MCKQKAQDHFEQRYKVRGEESVDIGGGYQVMQPVHPRWVTSHGKIPGITIIIDTKYFIHARDMARIFLHRVGIPYAETESMSFELWKPSGGVPARVTFISKDYAGELVVEHFEFGTEGLDALGRLKK